MELQRPFLKGEKIYLQPMDVNFFEPQYLDWVNNDEIIDNMTTLFMPTTEEGLKNYIKDNTNKNNAAFFAIRWKENNKFIGTVKLGEIDWVHRSASLGILIGDKDYRGRGIGTEAVRMMLLYGFRRLNLHWIGAGMVSENIASIKSFKKAGFKTVATIPNKLWYKGRYVDQVVMGITSEEYFKSK